MSHKLVIHAVIQLCAAHNIAPALLPALLLVDVCIYLAGTLLFFAVERPFLQLRQRVAR